MASIRLQTVPYHVPCRILWTLETQRVPKEIAAEDGSFVHIDHTPGRGKGCPQH